jgi:hypothetical protein
MSAIFLGLVYALENSDNDKYIVGSKCRFPLSLHIHIRIKADIGTE